MLVRRLSQACVPLLLTGLLSCSGNGGWPTAKTDPCSLLSTTEVAAALNEPVQAGKKTTDSICVFKATRHPQNEVTIEVDESPGKNRKGWFNKERMRSDRALIAGLGDGAVRVESPPSLARVTFLRGDTLITVMVSSVKHHNRGDAVTQLARAAADRYGAQSPIAMVSGVNSSPSTGNTSAVPAPAKSSSFTISPVSSTQSLPASTPTSTGPTRSPSIDHTNVIGTWYAHATTGMKTIQQMLVIQPNHEWTLFSTVQIEGVLDTGNGTWSFERSGARKEKSWQGTYQMKQEEGFSTTGSVTAQWTKIQPGQTPSRVPIELWQMRREEHEVRVSQLKSVDPTLVGLWEGTGTYKGGKADFVWWIKKSAATDVLIMESSKGMLRVKAGILRLVPAKGNRRGMAIVALQDKSFTTSDGKVTIRWNQTSTKPSQAKEL